MTVYENIKKYANLRGLSLQEVAKKAGLSPNALYRYNQGNSPKPDTTNKIAKALNVSPSDIDERLYSGDSYSHYYELNKKEKADIAVQAEKLIEGLESGAEVNFYGEPATDEQKNRLLIAIQTAMEMNKQEAKKKFTPKKYRD